MNSTTSQIRKQGMSMGQLSESGRKEESIEQWLPKDFVPAEITKDTIFGGLHQKVVICK